MEHDGIEVQESGTSDNIINISDVIEVIETDPAFVVNGQQMFLGGGEIRQSQRGVATMPVQRVAQMQMQTNQPYIKIVEQPASKALRFRYECEGRSAGSIPGASSTPENKTFPTIQVVGYRGRAVVVVSCVTKDEPYRAHPHNLVGREGCKKGVCTLEIPQETMTVTFSNLGIQCVKKKDIEEALRVREEIRVDPFRKGFSHRNQPTQIDLNAVRLCFQVFLEGAEPGKYTVPVQPVVSETIYDKKAMSDLVICKLSDCSASVAGGKEIILLCEKVAKEDIQVKFFEEKNNNTVWEGYGDFQPSSVHKQVAIAFRTPRYHSLDVTDSIKVYIQLWRPSDKACSEPLPFELLPLDAGRPPFWSLRKFQKKGDYSTFSQILSADNKILTLSKRNRIVKNKNDISVFEAQNQIQNFDLRDQNSNFKTVNPTIEVGHSISNFVAQNLEAGGPQNLNLEATPPNFDDENMSFDSENEPTLKEVLENTKEVLETTKKVLENNFDLENPPPLENPPENLFTNQIVQNNNLEQLQNNFDAQEPEILESKNENNGLNDLLNQVVELDEIYSDTQARLMLLTGDNQISETIIEPLNSTERIQNFDIDAENYSSLQMAFKNPIGLPPQSQNVILEVKGPKIDPKGTQKREILEEKVPFPPKRAKKNSISTLESHLGARGSLHSQNLEKKSNSVENLGYPNKKLPPTPSSTLPNPKKGGFFSKFFSKRRKPQKNQNDNDVIEVIEVDNETKASEIDRNDSNEFINLDLTEAENYALYTAMAPHATQSEFDELSCYYSPVEGGKIVSNSFDKAKIENS